VLNFRTKLIITLLLICLGNRNMVCAQESDTTARLTDTLNKKRLTTVLVVGASAYVGGMLVLYNQWYKDYPQSKFHFIDDRQEWLQMDKFGHITTSYYMGLIGYSSLRWAGVSENKSIWYGGMTGMLFLTTIEVMDGFSAQWGASPSDMVANVIGTSLFMGQQFAWHEQKMMMKFSYHSTTYAQYDPAQLGSTWAQSILKDYNGQTYWLSANISSFGLQHTRFPKWLNIAGGYSADGMTGPYVNPTEYNGAPVPYSERLRQYYIAPDIDLSRIPVKSKTLKLIFNALGFIKIPMPTVEFTKNGVKFFPLYF
jgi:hypothetical protein